MQPNGHYARMTDAEVAQIVGWIQPNGRTFPHNLAFYLPIELYLPAFEHGLAQDLTRDLNRALSSLSEGLLADLEDVVQTLESIAAQKLTRAGYFSRSSN